MAIFGQKHLIKCRCVLPQFKNSSDPEKKQHRFTVFSEVIDDVVKKKFSQCNNCGLIHKVTDICTSEIMSGKEAMSSILTIEDIKSSLHPSLASILERYQCDLPTWEQAQFIMENKRWGEIIILTSDIEDDSKVIKYLRILGETLFKVDSHSRKETLGV
jgi:hypothetical protein